MLVRSLHLSIVRFGNRELCGLGVRDLRSVVPFPCPAKSYYKTRRARQKKNN